ncbi:MAG: tetratricopeptide repeat protein, partial [Victivallales bacterium]|nr:tetratricopeptide repeat protein [Victivallales bacterium]
HDEDPLKLYNTASSPIWYIDDKEKECIYACGFLAFAAGKYDEAKAYWEKILSLSPDIAAIDQRLPNVQSRLLKACRLHVMSLWPENKADIKDQNIRLQLQYAEYLMMIERFPECLQRLEKLWNEVSETNARAAIALELGIALENAMKDKKLSAKYFEWILAQKKLRNDSLYARALFQYGYSLLGISDGAPRAAPLFAIFIKRFPDERDYIRSIYYLGFSYCQMNQFAKAEQLYTRLKEQNSPYADILRNDIVELTNFYQQEKKNEKK